MPIKLIPPKAGRSSNFRVRGTYLGIAVDRSTETSDKAKARKETLGDEEVTWLFTAYCGRSTLKL
jgi:hypothetical protein